MEITFKDDKLKKLLEEKGVLVTEGRELTRRIEELEKERAKIGLKIQKVKDKIAPIVDAKINPQLDEFEDIETVEIKDGMILVRKFSQLEEFKKAWRERKNIAK